ncbi:MAG: tetratricopeptide repeat protein [Arenimonas sp.]
MFATAAISAAEQKKTDSYKERLAKQAESYDAEGEKVETKEKQEVAKYPQATRVPASLKGTPGLVKLRNQMITSFQKGKDEDAKTAADKLELDGSANANDRAVAIQVKLLLVTKKDNNNHAAAIPLLEDAITTNGLSNNDHYDMMQQLVQRYLLDQDYQNALEKSDKFMNETKTETREVLLVKGNALYRLKKIKESVPVLEKAYALDSTDAPVTEMLARAYAETGQLEKAAALTKTLAQTSGNDHAAKINLAITYRDAKQYAQAADVIAELRESKQLLEERDYLTAMNVYQVMKNKENDMVAVVQEGLDKGILKPTANNYNVLAEAYYYSGRDDGTSKAIANWAKAAPMSKDGKVYLNLAIVQCQEERWAACKESAKNAIAKGGINTNDAKTQIAKADKELGQSK